MSPRGIVREYLERVVSRGEPEAFEGLPGLSFEQLEGKIGPSVSSGLIDPEHLVFAISAPHLAPQFL